MKKIFSKIIISFVLFSFIIPTYVFAADPTIKFELRDDKENKETLKRSWELTIKTTGIEVGKAVSIKIFSGTEELQAATYKPVKIETGGVGYYSTGYILNPATKYKIEAFYGTISASFEKTTIGKAAEIPVAKNTTDTFWFRDMDNAFRGTNGPLKLPGFTTSKECEDAKKIYWGNSTNTASSTPCSLITQEQVLLNFEAEKKINEKMPGKKDEPVPITAIGATENKSRYNLLAPIGKIKCMDWSETSNKVGADGEPECIDNNIGTYLNFIFKFGIGLCAAMAVVMLIIYGVVYMGDESVFGKTEAKSKMIGAVVGLLIALGGWVLLNSINRDLTGASGFKIDQTNVIIERTSGGGYFGVTIGASGGANANKNITEYDVFLKKAANKYGLECTLIKSFMYAESGGVNNLTSPYGAQGLIQLMPKTFNEQRVGSNPMDPETNIMAGASYLNYLKKNGCNGKAQSSVCDISNIQYLAASYNGGPGANKESKDCKNSTLWQCTNNSGYAETRIYAPRVEANFNKLKEKGWGC